MTRIILGISSEHDAGAALLVNGKVIAAVNEERLSRRKLVTGYPEQAIECVLRLAGIDRSEVTQVAVSTCIHVSEAAWDWWARDSRKVILTALLNRPLGKTLMRTRPALGAARAAGKAMSAGFRSDVRRRLSAQGVSAPVSFHDHHTSHAFSALATAGPERALVITLDAQGDGYCSLVGWWCNGKFHEWLRVPFFDSPAHYYGYVTHLLGFKQMEHEGKVTGLSARGDPARLGGLFEELCSFSSRHRHIVNNGGYLLPQIAKLKQAVSRCEPADIAAAVQQQLEVSVTSYVQHWLRRCPDSSTHLAVAGGVFANVLLNRRLMELPEVSGLSVHQHMGDGGLAYGAAVHADYLAAHEQAWAPPKLDHVYLGPEPERSDVEDAVRASGFEVLDHAEPAEIVAQLLSQGRCGAICRGAMEYGPRALGHRSILYRADDATVNDWLNERLDRTEFMPFAPMILAGREQDYLAGPLDAVADALPYMVVALPTTELCQARAPAISHVDHTARPQIVDEREPFCRDVLRCYERITGTPVLINTSFNRHGEPIVNTAAEATETARYSRLDFLVLDDHVLLNPNARDVAESPDQRDASMSATANIPNSR